MLAAGGPGELYRDSVYPRHCFGSLGLALEAGVEAVNLTESQFGIGTSREGFPWNLSGTYVAGDALCLFAATANGREHNFLADYYRTTQELASNTFRKGYQWPFHATRMLAFGSSLFDLAVLSERRRAGACSLDFNRNPRTGAAATRRSRSIALDADVSDLSRKIRRAAGLADRAACTR